MKRFFILATALFFSAALFAQNPLPNDPAVRVGKLENGMTYYIRHNDKPAQRAEFYLATNVGAIQETPDQDGLAHFLEHMCFNGTKNFPGKALLEYLQRIGAQFGRNINAGTGVEQTTYMLNNMPVTREGIIDSCLLVMHDYSHFVTCDPVEIDKERGVIIEERRSRRTPEWRVFEKAKHYYYGDSKYANCTLIGSQENLESFKPESLTNFYHTWYRPDLQALIVVGDVDVDSIEAKIKTLFADIPAVENPQPKEAYPVPAHAEPLIGVLTDPELSSSSIELLWKSEPMPIEFNATDIGFMTDLLKAIISNVMSERFTDITSKPNAPFISANLGIGSLCRTCDVVMGNISFKDGTVKEAFPAFLLEIEKAKRYGFSDAEVQRAKDNILSYYEKAVQGAESRTNAEFVRPLINNFFIKSPYMVPEQRYELAKAMMAQISAQVVSQVFAAAITDENISIVYTAPEKEGLVQPTVSELNEMLLASRTAEIQANEFEEIASSFVDADSLKGSKVKKESKGLYDSVVWTLKNGLKVIVLPTDYRKDQVLFRVWKKGGRSAISDEDLSSFENNVWGLYVSNTGISKFSNSQLNKMLAGKNISVTPYLNDSFHGVSGNFAPKDVETALQIIYLYFADPRFDQDEFQVGIDQLNAILPNYANQPGYKLQLALFDTIYGKNNPRVVSLTKETVEKANLKSIEKVYRQLFKDAAGTTVAIVGNVDPTTLKPLCEKYLGSIAKGKKAELADYGIPKILNGEIINHFKVDMQTPKNTVVQIVASDMPYSVEGDVMLSAAKHILDMIYTENLREEEGGTYGASTYLAIDEDTGEALAQVAFETNPTQSETLNKIAKESFRKLAYEGPTEEQMTRVRENLIKKIPENRISNKYWLNCIFDAERYGNDYNAEYEAAATTITAEKIMTTLQKMLEANNYIEVIMSPDKTAERE